MSQTGAVEAGGTGGSIPSEKNPKEIPFNELRDRALEECRKRGVVSKEGIIEVVNEQFDDVGGKRKGLLVGTMVRLLGLGNQEAKRKRGEDEGGKLVKPSDSDDLSIFIENLRNEVSQHPDNAQLAKLFYEILKDLAQDSATADTATLEKARKVYDDAVATHAEAFCEACRPKLLALFASFISNKDS